MLTNGLLLDTRALSARSGRSSRTASDYSLDFRISHGRLRRPTPTTRSAARAPSERILEGISSLYSAGLNPVITVTEVDSRTGSDAGKQRFFELLTELGIDKPRLKILPLFQIGAEADRGGAYESWQRLRQTDALEGGWEHLQCSSCRMVTDQGVWVCPILVNEPSARMGETIADTLRSFDLDHQACWTCHAYGVIQSREPSSSDCRAGSHGEAQDRGRTTGTFASRPRRLRS